jgi:tetratricopeptide (TPR) repeat protein
LTEQSEYFKTKALQSFSLGNYGLCAQNFETSLQRSTPFGERNQLFKDYQKLTQLYLLLNNSEKANAAYEKSLEYLENKGLNFRSLMLKFNLYFLNQDYLLAENIILKKALFTTKGNKKLEVECFLALGQVYLKKRQYVQAKWFFIQSYGVATKLNDERSQIQSLIYLTKVKNRIGDHKLALNDLVKIKAYKENLTNLYKIDIELEMAQTIPYL